MLFFLSYEKRLFHVGEGLNILLYIFGQQLYTFVGNCYGSSFTDAAIHNCSL